MAIVGLAKYTYVRAKFRGGATRGERRKFGASFACVSSKFRSRMRVYFARPTVAIAKIKDYSQSIKSVKIDTS